jgi:hypothetical protein
VRIGEGLVLKRDINLYSVSEGLRLKLKLFTKLPFFFLYKIGLGLEVWAQPVTVKDKIVFLVNKLRVDRCQALIGLKREFEEGMSE